MRPGRLGPGRASPSCGAGTATRRFNEAGAIRPRKGFVYSFIAHTFIRFNEAGAIRPRKGTPHTASCRLPPCFNEAGAIRPRKGAVSGGLVADSIKLQ